MRRLGGTEKQAQQFSARTTWSPVLPFILVPVSGGFPGWRWAGVLTTMAPMSANAASLASSTSPPSGAAALEALVEGIDKGIEAHLAWNQKLMRCALLHESPGEDMMRPQAHQLCRFGVWFAKAHARLAHMDEALVRRIDHHHQALHQAVRDLCELALQGHPAQAADLAAYEGSQSEMVQALHALRQIIVQAGSRCDVLTGLPLRNGMEYAFELRRKDAVRHGQTLWLVMVDIDHFKAVNDTHGHGVGDLALRHVARVLSEGLRESDALIRFGGEEFLGLFLVGDGRGVHVLAERMLQALRDAPLRTEHGLVLPLTVSAGWARVRPDELLPHAVERADHALLHGKTHGRNRYVLAPD